MRVTEWPSDNPKFDKDAFCRDFQQSVRYVWKAFSNSPECAQRSGADQDACTVDAIVTFKSNDKGKLNETVQALMRSVPYVEYGKGNVRWSFDKFLLNWPPAVSAFNLFPYVGLVHNATWGVDAPGAYSFSIDDRYGNYQNRGSGFSVDIGGGKHLLTRLLMTSGSSIVSPSQRDGTTLRYAVARSRSRTVSAATRRCRFGRTGRRKNLRHRILYLEGG